MSDIFISHKTLDKQDIWKFVEAMAMMKWPLWVDAPEGFGAKIAPYLNIVGIPISEYWHPAIEKALNKSALVFVFWTKLSVASFNDIEKSSDDLRKTDVFYQEVDRADRAGKLVHMLMTGVIPHRFKKSQCIQLNNMLGDDPIDIGREIRNRLGDSHTFKSHFAHFSSERIKELYQIDSDQQYVSWRTNAVEPLHPEAMHGPLKSVSFPTIAGVRYPIVCLPSSDTSSGFTHSRICGSDFIFEKRPLFPTYDELCRTLTTTDFKDVDGVDYDGDQVRYFELLTFGEKIKRPNQPGYCLSSISLSQDLRVQSFHARVCHYMENYLTSHRREYVMLLDYERQTQMASKSDLSGRATSGRFDWWQTLRLDKTENGFELSYNNPGGVEFDSLISVQAISIFKRQGRWHFAFAKRGETVAVAPGALQLIPAGGFETMGSHDASVDDLTTRSHLTRFFDIEATLVRELLEELFGDREMRDAGPDAIEGLPGYQQIRPRLNDGRIEIRFLGVVMDLTRLRPEFSFAIVFNEDDVGDLQYDTSKGRAAFFTRNEDEASGLYSVPIGDLAKNLSLPNEKWLETSAGLARLFQSWITNDPLAMEKFELTPAGLAATG